MIDPNDLLARIDALAKNDSERDYLGASEIGHECSRYLWLKFHKYVEPEQFEPRMLRLFQRGKNEELIFETHIYDLGIEILERCTDQAGFKDGFFAGHGDGVYLIDGERVAAEMKTHSLKSFGMLKRGKLLQTHPKHYAQCIMYAGKFNCAYALYMAVNKNDDELFFDVIDFNQEEYKEYCDRAEYITTADKPPDRIASKSSDYRCKMCHAHAVCWGLEMPRVNCRNCTSVAKEPINGKFLCEKNDDKKLDTSGNCSAHSFNPYAMHDLQGYEPIEFFPSQRAVKYKKPDGTEVTNGFDFVQSKDLQP